MTTPAPARSVSAYNPKNWFFGMTITSIAGLLGVLACLFADQVPAPRFAVGIGLPLLWIIGLVVQFNSVTAR